MDSKDIPVSLAQLLDTIVPAIRRAYEVNAERHDQMVGDDLTTFAIAVYRNSWYLIEEAVQELDDWSTSRPEGSLVVTNGHHRVHVYRAGPNEFVDLDALRFDHESASITKRSIAGSNSQQLAFQFEELEREALVAAAAQQTTDLHEIVVLHAGNPDDAMCAVWIGAPVANATPSASPWAWKCPVTTVRRSEAPPEQAAKAFEIPRHDQMPEPDLALSPVAEADRDARLQ
jgi:hypothetical protein